MSQFSNMSLKDKILFVLFDGKSFNRYDAIRITSACNSRLSDVVPVLLELLAAGQIFSFDIQKNVAPGRWEPQTVFMHHQAERA